MKTKHLSLLLLYNFIVWKTYCTVSSFNKTYFMYFTKNKKVVNAAYFKVIIKPYIYSCVHHCASIQQCLLINYNEGNKECRLYDQPFQVGMDTEGWITVEKVLEDFPNQCGISIHCDIHKVCMTEEIQSACNTVSDSSTETHGMEYSTVCSPTNYDITLNYLEQTNTIQKVKPMSGNIDKFTTCSEFNYNPLSTGFPGIFSAGTVSDICNRLGVFVMNDKELRIILKHKMYYTGYYARGGEWYQMCITNKQDSNVNLYINGTLINAMPWIATSTDGLIDRYVIGQQLDRSDGECNVMPPIEGFYGELRNVNLWSRILTGDEILQVYEGNYHSVPDVLYWKDIVKDIEEIKGRLEKSKMNE